MSDYVDAIISSFQLASNPLIAKSQSAYMKNRFAFFGIKSPERKALQQPFFHKDQRPDKSDLTEIVKSLWQQPQRELQYCAQELALKYLKSQTKNDLYRMLF